MVSESRAGERVIFALAWISAGLVRHMFPINHVVRLSGLVVPDKFENGWYVRAGVPDVPDNRGKMASMSQVTNHVKSDGPEACMFPTHCNRQCHCCARCFPIGKD